MHDDRAVKRVGADGVGRGGVDEVGDVLEWVGEVVEGRRGTREDAQARHGGQEGRVGREGRMDGRLDDSIWCDGAMRWTVFQRTKYCAGLLGIYYRYICVGLSD